MNNTAVTAAIYIRWSTDDQGSGTTLAEQRESGLRWACERGLNLSPDHIFVDDGVSGAKESRPALNRLNRLIQAGTISLVIVYKLDRLARRPYVAYKLVEEWRGKASLVSVTESHIDTTSTVGELGFGIATVFASHERNTIRDRTMSGKRRRAAEGRNPGVRPPYGYVIREKRFVINADEAVIVRRLYDASLAGQTDGQIARMLNDTGMRTRLGGPWHSSAVQRIVQNPAYTGLLVYRDITAEGAFAVIVDRARWEQVQQLRRQKATSHPRRIGSASPYVLSGRLVCARCGRPMNGRVCRNGKHENRYYACTGYIQFRDCACRMVRQEVIEQAVIAAVLPLLDQLELNCRIRARLNSSVDQLNQEIDVLQGRLRDLEQQLARGRLDYRCDRIDAVTLCRLQADIEADGAAMANSVAAKQAEMMAAKADTERGDELWQPVRVLHAWDGLSYAQQKQIIQLVTERISWDHQTAKLQVETSV